MPFDQAANLDAQIVRAAYGVVIEPWRLPQFMGLMAVRLDELLKADLDDREITAALAHLEQPIAAAHEMLIERGRRSDPAAPAVRNLRENPAPVFLMKPNGTVRYANQAAVETFGVAEERPLPEGMLTAAAKKQLLEELSRLSWKQSSVVATFEAEAQLPGRPSVQLGLTASSTPEGLLGNLSSVRVTWLDYVGRHFSRAFSLTPVETEITKAVVSGQTLEELAALRGRAIGTVRNQKKRLLAKLGLRSQTELACLYAGFAQLSRLPPEGDKTRAFADEPDRRTHMLTVPGGGTLHAEIVGPERGRPVLLLHSLLGGTGLTPPQRQIIQRRKVRLIMPLRPCYGATHLPGPLETQAVRYAELLMHLMDDLGAPSAPVLFANAAAPYAFAFSQRATHRCERLVGGGGHLPLAESAGLRYMNMAARLSYSFAFYAPFINEFFCRAVLHMTGSGFDEEFVLGLLAGSASDQAMIADSEYRYLARNFLTYIDLDGPNPAANELAVGALPWFELTAEAQVPVTLFYGDEDPRFGGASGCFAKRRPHVAIKRLPEAGQLVLAKHFATLLDAALGGP